MQVDVDGWIMALMALIPTNLAVDVDLGIRWILHHHLLNLHAAELRLAQGGSVELHISTYTKGPQHNRQHNYKQVCAHSAL